MSIQNFGPGDRGFAWINCGKVYAWKRHSNIAAHYGQTYDQMACSFEGRDPGI